MDPPAGTGLVGTSIHQDDGHAAPAHSGQDPKQPSPTRPRRTGEKEALTNRCRTHISTPEKSATFGQMDEMTPR